jgi:hypothetical protein
VAEAARPVIVRNSRTVIACIWIFAFISVIIGVLSAVEACHVLFQLQGHTLMRVLSGIQWAGAGLGLGGIGVAAWQQARKSAFAQVRLESDGAHFRFGTVKKPFEKFFAWEQISAVILQSRPNNQYVFVSGHNGTKVNYTAYDIFRYKSWRAK